METRLTLICKEIATSPGAYLIKLDGDLDADNVEAVLDTTTSIIEEGGSVVVMDCQRLRYVNSTGLGILLHLNMLVRNRNGCLKLAAVNEDILELIDIIGATRLFEIHETTQGAVLSLAPSGEGPIPATADTAGR